MARPILQTFAHLNNGTFLSDATDVLAQVVKAVEARGKSGSVTIQINVRKASRGGAMGVSAEITTKLPKEEKFEALMWATPEGSLLTSDPAQAKLDLRAVTDDKGPARRFDVDPDTGEIKKVGEDAGPAQSIGAAD